MTDPVTAVTARRGRRQLRALRDAGAVFVAEQRLPSLSPLVTVATTRAARQADPIITLLRRGAITSTQARAARQIERVFITTTAALGLRTSPVGVAAAGRSGGADIAFSLLQAALSGQYALWRDAAARVPLAGSSTLGDLTLAAVIDGQPPRALEQRFRLRHGTALPLLRHGLDLWP